MRRAAFIFLIISVVSLCSWAKSVLADAGTTMAVLQQTIVQTAEHARQLEEAIQNIQLLQTQVQNTQQMLQLAIKASEGVDGLEAINNFRNSVIQTSNVLNELKTFVNTDSDVSDQWKNVFGSLDQWVQNSNQAFTNIDMSDRTSSSSYLIADSYQKLFEQNSETVNQFIENSKNVSEKGALKQIAQEMAHLIEMENNVVLLLSQILKAQSVEQSNTNLDRKSDVIKFEQENDGIRQFMNMTTEI